MTDGTAIQWKQAKTGYQIAVSFHAGSASQAFVRGIFRTRMRRSPARMAHDSIAVLRVYTGNLRRICVFVKSGPIAIAIISDRTSSTGIPPEISSACPKRTT